LQVEVGSAGGLVKSTVISNLCIAKMVVEAKAEHHMSRNSTKWYRRHREERFMMWLVSILAAVVALAAGYETIAWAMAP
jgi:phosphate/sulfate permease